MLFVGGKDACMGRHGFRYNLDLDIIRLRHY